MNRGLISVVSVLTEDHWGTNSGGVPRDAFESPAQINRQRLPEVGGIVIDNESTRYRHWVSDASMLTESDATPKAVKFSHRSLWCCFFLIMPVVIPVLIYIKDSDVTRRIFLGFFIVVLIVLLVCFSLVIFQTRTRQMLAMRHNSDAEDDHVGLRNLRPSTLTQANPNLLAATHRLLTTSHHIRPAYRVARTTETSPTNRQTVRFQSPLHSQSIPHSSPLRRIASAPSTPCSSSVSTTAINDPLQIMQRHLNQFHLVAASREGFRLPLTRPLDNPPPYHVAINLPAPETVVGLAVETPPPPYENAMN